MAQLSRFDVDGEFSLIQKVKELENVLVSGNSLSFELCPINCALALSLANSDDDADAKYLS